MATKMTKHIKKPVPAKRERRKEGRIPEENKVKFRIISNNKQSHLRKSYYALTKDISVGGISILTEQNLPIGTELRLELALLDSNKLISLTGKVIWTHSLYGNELYEMGVKFQEMPPKKTLALIEHIYEKKQ